MQYNCYLPLVIMYIHYYIFNALHHLIEQHFLMVLYKYIYIINKATYKHITIHVNNNM